MFRRRCSIFKNELKKKDADWQQKLDLIVHQFTKQYDSLKSSSFSRRENSVSQETSISQSVQNPIQNNPTPILQIKFAALTEYAQKPKRGSEFSAGIDLRSAYEYLVPANGNKLIKNRLENSISRWIFWEKYVQDQDYR